MGLIERLLLSPALSDDLLKTRRLDIWKSLIEIRAFRCREIKLPTLEPNTEQSQHALQSLLGEERVNVHMAGKLCDLALLQLLNWVVGSLEFGP